MYDSGIDVIYAAAGGSGNGLFEAALESGKEPGEIYAIGVDSDQYEAVAPELQPYILTSALKRVDVATYEAITDMLNGELTGEIKVYDVANNGVGYAVSNEAINQYAGTLEELKAQIIDGTIVVPDGSGRLSPEGPEVGGGRRFPGALSRPARHCSRDGDRGADRGHRAARHREALPGRGRQRRRQPQRDAGHDPRHRGRERRRQVDADEDPLRRPAGPTRGTSWSTGSSSTSARPATPSTSASAWCSSTSCWPTT